MSYKYDRDWSDRYLLRIRSIVGAHLLVPSSVEQDQKMASDLIILTAKNMTIACRMRRPGYLAYEDDFTIRCARDSGAKTEYEKIMEGFGDWFFYGHAEDETTNKISKWMIIDLNSLRHHIKSNLGQFFFSSQENEDGTYFLAFNSKTFPKNPPLIIAENKQPVSIKETAI